MKNTEQKKVKPFIKWVGGKGQLLNDLRKKYPTQANLEIKKYCEPFVGGGAVLFDIVEYFNFSEIRINDINAELINTYRVIRDEIETLIDSLLFLQNEYTEKTLEERKALYYMKRDRFNDIKINGDKFKNIEKAALFIFLNKTCFNGLYRINSKGLYNVPMGDYKNPMICDAANLRTVHKVLEKVEISCGDYSGCRNFIDSSTFVYIDPPYRPITKTSSFTSYSEFEFADKQQIQLGSFVDEIAETGAKVVLSNSDPTNSDKSDYFFDNLYSKHIIQRIEAKRMINSDSKNRGNIKEILVSNF